MSLETSNGSSSSKYTSRYSKYEKPKENPTDIIESRIQSILADHGIKKNFMSGHRVAKDHHRGSVHTKSVNNEKSKHTNSGIIDTESKYSLKVKNDFLDSSSDMSFMDHASSAWRLYMTNGIEPHYSSSVVSTEKRYDESYLQRLPEHVIFSNGKRLDMSRLNHAEKLHGIMNLSHKLVGDQYIFIAIQSLERDKYVDCSSNTLYRQLNLRDNRITEKCFNLILPMLTESDMLISIDLSENSIQKQGAKLLAKYVIQSHRLKKLALEKMSLNDIWMKEFHQTIISQSNLSKAHDSRILSLISLNLSRNKLGDSSVEYLVSLLPNMLHLLELDLSWNEVKFKGISSLSRVLDTPKSSLVSLDLSWNSIGTATDTKRSAAKAMSYILANNSSLTHLNLSHNHLTAEDCKVIGEGLEHNHALLGLHISGNEGRLDAFGHLIPYTEYKGSENIASAHYSAATMIRIVHPSSSLQLSPSKASMFAKSSGSWDIRKSCWICGGWREWRFSFNLNLFSQDFSSYKSKRPEDYQVYLVTSFDDWLPEEMIRISYLSDNDSSIQQRGISTERKDSTDCDDPQLYSLKPTKSYRKDSMSHGDLQKLRRQLSNSTNDNIHVSMSTCSPIKSVHFDDRIAADPSPLKGKSKANRILLHDRQDFPDTFDTDNSNEILSELDDDFNADSLAHIVDEDSIFEAEGPEYEIFRMVPPGR